MLVFWFIMFSFIVKDTQVFWPYCGPNKVIRFSLWNTYISLLMLSFATQLSFCLLLYSIALYVHNKSLPCSTWSILHAYWRWSKCKKYLMLSVYKCAVQKSVYKCFSSHLLKTLVHCVRSARIVDYLRSLKLLIPVIHAGLKRKMF